MCRRGPAREWGCGSGGMLHVMRARSEFGLFKRRINGRIVYYYYIWDESNRRVYRSTGERQKCRALDYVMSMRDKGLLGTRDRCMISLRDYVRDFYIPDKCPIVKNARMHGKSISRGTCATRRRALSLHVLPHLGHLPLWSITRAKVNRWLLDLPSTDKASRTSANAYFDTLKQVLDQAVHDGLIPDNPCEKMERLGTDSVRREAFTTDEVRKIIGKPCDWDNFLIRTMCLTAALTGMRIGEIRALRPDAVTDTAIYVRASFSDNDGFKAPKNGEARVAPIPAALRDQLRLLFPSDGGYIFRMVGDKPISSQYVLTKLKKRMADVGISGKTFHSFRAYFNTEMMSANVNETVVRAVIGHQSADMTEHYLHLEAGEFSQIRKVQESILEEVFV